MAVMRNLKQAARQIGICLITAIVGVAPGMSRADQYLVGIESVEYLPHYSAVGEEVYGYVRDLMDAFAEDSGYRFRYKAYPVIRLSHSLADGIVDFKYPANPNWDQHTTAKLTFSDPIVQYTDGLHVQPENLGQDVKTIAIVRGFTPEAYLSALQDNKIRISQHGSLRDVVLHVLRGRSDAAYGDRDVMKYYLTNFLHRPDALVFDSQAQYIQDNFRLATTRHPGIIAQFNNWQKNNPDRIAELKDNYGLK